MKPRTLLTAALLGGCIALLQYHAIQFWLAHTGALGAAWSLLLEGAALWLWSDARATRRALGGLVTVLLLAGPLYQVSEPLIDEAQRTGNTSTARADRITAIEGEIHTLDRALSTYLNNSQTRQGWVARIDHTQARIEALRTEQASLTAAAIEPARMPWQRAAVIGMQALAIVIFQVVAVLCIGELRSRRADAVGAALAASFSGSAIAGKPAPTGAPRPASGVVANFPNATGKTLRRAVA